MSLQPVFKVSELVEVINQHLSLLGEVVIEGELSRLDVKNGRLIFATIKDRNSSIDVFGLSHVIRNVHQLEAGMMVHVHGTAGLYKGSGRFRVQASEITPHGAGALQLALDKLRQKLDQEGVFDISHKRPIPEWSEKIGLITAKNSSAYFDLVKIIKSRMGGLKIKLLPVNVQGRDAVTTMLKALAYVNENSDDFDVVILSRGGGSLEDLQAFNDERVVRAVFSSKVPIISGVGHEDDWCLTDDAADIRASTPSNAAEQVVRDMKGVNFYLESLIDQMKGKLLLRLRKSDQRITEQVAKMKLYFRAIVNRLNSASINLERVRERVIKRILIQTEVNSSNLEMMKKALLNKLENSREKILGLEKLIEAMNIEGILKRGFSITQDEDGKVIGSVNQVKINQKLRTTLDSGLLKSVIIEKGEYD